ncbi:hypothetical protein ACFOJ6_13920 [Gordonia humi]
MPDRHLGAAAALAHADEIIGQISDVLFDYQTVPDGLIGLKSVVDGDVVRAVVESVKPIPRKLPLLVADALVVLRNAVEHTLFTEVEFRDGRLSNALARQVEMPAAKSREDFDNWVAAKGRKRPDSLHAGSDLVDRIDRLQPFHMGEDHPLHPLARLVLHTNHAKHREPAVTAVRIAASYADDSRPQSIDDVEKGPEVPLLVGDVIGDPTPVGELAPITMFPNIGINRPLTDDWPELLTELREIFDWVRCEALPVLITGGDAAEPDLPCRYEISLGHTDERAAIIEGSDVSAVTRHSRRLVAANLRIDLAELITQIDRIIGPEQVTRWFDHLSDDAVIEWSDLLAARAHLDPATRERYIRRTLLKMRDAALEF